MGFFSDIGLIFEAATTDPLGLLRGTGAELAGPAARSARFARDAVVRSSPALQAFDFAVVDIDGDGNGFGELFIENIPIAIRDDLVRPLTGAAGSVVDAVQANKSLISLVMLVLLGVVVIVLFGPAVRGVSSAVGGVFGSIGKAV